MSITDVTFAPKNLKIKSIYSILETKKDDTYLIGSIPLTAKILSDIDILGPSLQYSLPPIHTGKKYPSMGKKFNRFVLSQRFRTIIFLSFNLMNSQKDDQFQQSPMQLDSLHCLHRVKN
jgi:hypothetical protein